VFEVGTPNIGGAAADSLSIEFYTEETGTFALDSVENSNYDTCSQCVRLFQDLVGTDSDTEYFQSSGTMYVTPSSQPMNGSLEVTLESVTLVEVTVDSDTFESVVVPGGACWNLNSPLTLMSL